MRYAGGRVILDADSHVMELADFLDDFIDPLERDRLRRRGMDALSPVLEEAKRRAVSRGSSTAAAASAEERLMQDKGWMALGGFDPAERGRVLDLLGFNGQMVFATFATAMFNLPRSIGRYEDKTELARDLDLLYAGCRAIMVPSTAAGERAPTHPDLDGFWALLEKADTPFVLHVGGGGRLLDRAFHNNDMPVTDHLGGGENIRSKDYLAIYHSPALFLGTLILDGLFDRFPDLRGGCIEQGAGWVISWMHHLDYAQRAFRRTEEPLRRLAAKPSEYVHRHLKFTPFPGEPVGWMVEQAGGDLFMFSTDYPHPEGGRDPLAKFEEELQGVSTEDRDRFYHGNMAELLSCQSLVAER